MSRKNPIGIFDSGVGGLCVLKEIRRQIPGESINYLADSSNCPYGSKDTKETLTLSRKHIEFLLEKGCKAIVIACNTVTAAAIKDFRAEYKIPFIGMEPAIKPAALQTRTQKIGVLATEATLKSPLFKETFQKHTNGVDVIIQAGNGLVELVENGDHDSEKVIELLKQYLNPMLENNADIIVLGCTHYPFLKNAIRKVTNNQVLIMDPSKAVAAQTRRILEQFNLINDSNDGACLHFYSTGQTAVAENIISREVGDPCIFEQIDP